MHFFTSENDEMLYGCLFCASGREDHIASIMEKDWPGVMARPVKAVKRRSTEGVKWFEEQVILPGYVFYRAPEGFYPRPPFPEGVIRFLTTVDGDIALRGSDETFARWMLMHDGVLALSRAVRTDSGVEFTSGPIKDLLKYVLKVDRRNRNALVHLEIYEHQTNIWLPFEFDEP